MTDNSELVAPCPFCGSFTGESEIGALNAPLAVWVDDDDLLSVVCRECEAFGPKAKTQAEAITAWNTRSTPNVDELVALLEKAAPFVGWASTRHQVIAGVHADELCDAIDAALQQKDARV